MERKGREGKGGASPRADLDTAKTRRSDARIRNADRRSRSALRLTLSSAIEKQIRGRPVREESLHVARRVAGSIFIAGQGERHIGFSIPIIRATDVVAIVTGAASRYVPVRRRAIDHDGVHVRVNGAGNDPFVGFQAF